MYANDKVVLLPLTVADAGTYYELYTHRVPTPGLYESPFLPGEGPEAFTQRILSLCTRLYSIRPAGDRARIIGDCALHHWDPGARTLELGGSLFPEYQGKGYMAAAFALLKGIARDELQAAALLGNTSPRNRAALRLVEKLGFVPVHRTDSEVTLRKELVSA